MPSTIVHLGFAFLIAAAILTDHLDRRALLVVSVVIIIPEVDTLLGPFMDGAHRAVGHNLVFPALVTIVLAWDCWWRADSTLRKRCGEWGVQVSLATMVALFFAHLLLDWAHLEGINMFWPLYDSFYRIEGELYVTASGVTQTYVDLSEGDVGSVGTTADTHISNPVEPTAEPTEDPTVKNTIPFAATGWELYLVVTGLFVLGARRLQGEEPA